MAQTTTTPTTPTQIPVGAFSDASAFDRRKAAPKKRAAAFTVVDEFLASDKNAVFVDSIVKGTKTETNPDKIYSQLMHAKRAHNSDPLNVNTQLELHKGQIGDKTRVKLSRVIPLEPKMIAPAIEQTAVKPAEKQVSGKKS